MRRSISQETCLPEYDKQFLDQLFIDLTVLPAGRALVVCTDFRNMIMVRFIRNIWISPI